MPESTPDWTGIQETLLQLLEMIEATEAVAKEGLLSNQADLLAARSGELSQALAAAQPLLASALAQGLPPAQIKQRVQEVQSRLDNLRETTTRLQAVTERALGVLFPADQVQAYSRLGKGYGAQAKPGSAYLKA